MTNDEDAILSSNEPSRREFVKALLASGFALAVGPLSAETIRTDSEGLNVGDVRIPGADREIPGYCAAPNRGGPLPVVIVISEIFGVHEHIRDLCRRLAKRGYLAVAPDLFVRQGDVVQMQDIKQILDQVISKVPDVQVLADLDATSQWVQSTRQGDSRRLAITGFCWGGRMVWLYAAHNPTIKAGVAWYGRLNSPKTPLQAQQPMDVVASLKAPVLGLYGGADEGIPMTSIQDLQNALAAAHSASKIIVYPDAPHGFNADYRPSYREPVAKQAWQQMLNWFQQHEVS